MRMVVTLYPSRRLVKCSEMSKLGQPIKTGPQLDTGILVRVRGSNVGSRACLPAADLESQGVATTVATDI
jgi:hypothetical protein